MNRASLSVTTVALVALLTLFAPHVLPHGTGGGSAHPEMPPAPTSCPRPSFGPADTDAVLLCIAAQHERS